MAYTNGISNGTSSAGQRLSGKSAAAYVMPEKKPDTLQPQNTKVALYQKLLRVMEECGYIQKDKRNAFHNYTYASEAAIKKALHAALVKHHLLFFPSISEITERTELGKDGRDALTTIRVNFRFVDADSGESESGEFFGTGIDPADKGVYKAIAGAIKYVLTSWFLIATGDDPEEQSQQLDSATPEPPPGESRAAGSPRKSASKQGVIHKPWKSFGEMKEYFARVREQVGEVIYAEELGKCGVEHPSQFKSAKVAADCFNRLYAISKKPEVA